jgi:hypothetical protein
MRQPLAVCPTASSSAATSHGDRLRPQTDTARASWRGRPSQDCALRSSSDRELAMAILRMRAPARPQAPLRWTPPGRVICGRIGCCASSAMETEEQPRRICQVCAPGQHRARRVWPWCARSDFRQALRRSRYRANPRPMGRKYLAIARVTLHVLAIEHGRRRALGAPREERVRRDPDRQWAASGSMMEGDAVSLNRSVERHWPSLNRSVECNGPCRRPEVI